MLTNQQGNPGVGGQPTGAGTDVAGKGNNSGGGETFTQEQVNQIVSKRVNEVKAQFSQTEADAKLLHNLLADPDFQGWMSGGRGNASGGGNPGGGTPNANDPLAGLADEDGNIHVSKLGPALKQLVQAELQGAIAPINKEVANLGNATRGMGMVAELQRYSNTLDDKGMPKFPNLWNEQFRGSVTDIMARGRAANVEDAYILAARDFEKQGLDIPQSAFLMESHGGGAFGGGNRGGDQGTKAPVITQADIPQTANIFDVLNKVAERVLPQNQSGG